MLSQANILDLYYKIDRKKTKLDNECLTIYTINIQIIIIIYD